MYCCKTKATFLLFCAALWLFAAQPARCEFSTDYANLHYDASPLYVWRDDSRPPRACIIGAHGMTLHGGTFDAMAHWLVSRGYDVYAPDMVGFGRWETVVRGAYGQTILYTPSMENIASLAKRLRAAYPNVPIFCAGESLGANLALNLVYEHPDLLDGIILSSPCINRYWHLSPHVLKECWLSTIHPQRIVNLDSYVPRYLSDDSRVTDSYREDPLIRKQMRFTDLFKSVLYNRHCITLVPDLPESLPVLILQGTADRIYNPSGVKRMLRRMPCEDKTIFWAQGRGHLLLETPFVRPEILQEITAWLDAQVNSKAHLHSASGSGSTCQTSKLMAAPTYPAPGT